MSQAAPSPSLSLELTHLHEVCCSVWMCKFVQVSSRTVLDSGQQTVGQLDRELDKLLALKVKSVGVEHAQFGWTAMRGAVEKGLRGRWHDSWKTNNNGTHWFDQGQRDSGTMEDRATGGHSDRRTEGVNNAKETVTTLELWLARRQAGQLADGIARTEIKLKLQ